MRRKPMHVPTDREERHAVENGASMAEWGEFRRTNTITVSMHVKWWCRRVWRVLR